MLFVKTFHKGFTGRYPYHYVVVQEISEGTAQDLLSRYVSSVATIMADDFTHITEAGDLASVRIHANIFDGSIEDYFRSGAADWHYSGRLAFEYANDADDQVALAAMRSFNSLHLKYKVEMDTEEELPF